VAAYYNDMNLSQVANSDLGGWVTGFLTGITALQGAVATPLADDLRRELDKILAEINRRAHVRPIEYLTRIAD